MLTINTPCGYRTAREDLAPLTLMDARMPVTVARWLDAWLTTTPAIITPLVGRLKVYVTGVGILATWYAGEGYTYHQDSAALVAYVVAWARAL